MNAGHHSICRNIVVVHWRLEVEILFLCEDTDPIVQFNTGIAVRFPNSIESGGGPVTCHLDTGIVVRFPNPTSECLKSGGEPVNVIAILHCGCKYQHWTQVGKLIVS